MASSLGDLVRVVSAVGREEVRVGHGVRLCVLRLQPLHGGVVVAHPLLISPRGVWPFDSSLRLSSPAYPLCASAAALDQFRIG